MNRRGEVREEDGSDKAVHGRSVVRAPETVRLSAQYFLKKFPSWRWTISDIKPYKNYPSKRVMTYNVVRVVSPSEFYLRFSMGKSASDYANFFQEMQEFYAVEANKKMMMLKFGRVFRGRCYACQNPSDGKWYRVRVYDIKQRQKIVTVFFCDEAKLQEVPLESLLEIQLQFTRLASQVFACYLYDVVPVGGKGLKWSEDAIQRFREIVTGKDLVGICLAQSGILMKQGFPDVISFMGLALYDKRGGECTINSLMVDEGFGSAIGIFAGCKHSLDIPDHLPKFDSGAFREEFPMPVAPPEKKHVPPTSLDEATCLRYRPPMNWLPKVAEMNSWLNIEEVIPSYANATEHLPSQFADRLACVNLTFALGAGFVAHLKSRMNELKGMEDSLKEVVEKASPLLINQIHPGDFIACLLYVDEKPIWHRGVVLKHSQIRQSVEMLLTDYGGTVRVKVSRCRRLPQFFKNIPSFAIRCHLDPSNVLPNEQNGWSDSARNFFEKNLDFDLDYFMYRRTNDWVDLTDLFQDVRFDVATKSWIAGPTKERSSMITINKGRNHPMLFSLYRSFGVELFSEAVRDGVPFWFFNNMADCLVKEGYAHFDLTSKKKSEIHMHMVSLCKLRRVIRIPSPPIEHEVYVAGKRAVVKLGEKAK